MHSRWNLSFPTVSTMLLFVLLFAVLLLLLGFWRTNSAQIVLPPPHGVDGHITLAVVHQHRIVFLAIGRFHFFSQRQSVLFLTDTSRASISSAASIPTACSFSSAYVLRHLSNSAAYFSSCFVSRFKFSLHSRNTFLTSAIPVSSLQSNELRSIVFSDFSSSKSSVSSAICFAKSLWATNW